MGEQECCWSVWSAVSDCLRAFSLHQTSETTCLQVLPCLVSWTREEERGRRRGEEEEEGEVRQLVERGWGLCEGVWSQSDATWVLLIGQEVL